MPDAPVEPSDPPGQLIVTEDLGTAAELIDALRPTNERWAGQSLRWIFRGHADAEWELVPTALRKSSWRAFRPGYDPDASIQETRDQTEWGILREFGDRLDRAGLPIPGKTREDLDQQDPHQLKPEQLTSYIELAALAQHHGVPTRLLDFTRSGLVAAYFAGLEPREGAPDRLCVWAVDGSFFTLGHTYQIRSHGLALVRGSRAFNVNQHAQDGLLGLWATPSEPHWQGPGVATLGDLMEILSVAASEQAQRGKSSWSPGSTIVNEIINRLQRRTTFARKLTVPRSEAPVLLRMLANERITAATLFPGVSGVVQGMRESVRYEIVDHDFWAV